MRKLKVIWIFCIIVYIATLIYAFYVNWQGKYFGMTFVACLTPWIVPAFMKGIHVKVPLEFHIVNMVFVYFASLWGSCLGGYQLPYYDKFIHCASGVVLCEMIYLLYKNYWRDDKRRLPMFIFLNGVNASVALLWEFYEYALLILFQYDAIKHYSTGVHDSITDMLVAVIGGIILSLYLIRYDQIEKGHFFVSLERKIYLMNRKNK